MFKQQETHDIIILHSILIYTLFAYIIFLLIFGGYCSHRPNAVATCSLSGGGYCYADYMTTGRTAAKQGRDPVVCKVLKLFESELSEF